jgi:hypothetical protein
MRCLHVLDALDDRAPVRALAHLLRRTAFESAAELLPGVHDVIVPSGGALDESIRESARRVSVATSGLELTAAVLTGDYDVVHALDRRIARRLAPLLTSATSAAFVYSAPALTSPTRGSAFDTAERAILAACDLVVLPPAAAASAGLTASITHRSVHLDLARLAEPGQLAADGGPAFALDASELRFIAREWAATLGSAHRRLTHSTREESAHP